jgi:hypothetical protein
VDQGQFSDPDFISGTHQMENVQFANRWILFVYLFALMLNVCRKLNYEISHLIICMWGVCFRQKYDKSWYWICQLYYTRIYIFIQTLL